MPHWTSDDAAIYELLQSEPHIGSVVVYQKGNNHLGLPDITWIWSEDSWQLAYNYGSGRFSEDSECWFYAQSWKSQLFAGKKAFNHFVRRRYWNRTRRLKMASEFVDEMLSQGFNEADIIKAFRSVIEHLHEKSFLLKV